MTIAKGNTYNAKESLKACGFKWDADKKEWSAESPDMEKWKSKMCNPTYNGRKEARFCSEIKFIN